MYIKLIISCTCTFIILSCNVKPKIVENKNDTNTLYKSVTVDQAKKSIDSIINLPRDTSDHTRSFEDVDKKSSEYKKVIKMLKKLTRQKEENITILSYDSTTKQYYFALDRKGLCNLLYFTPSTNKIVNECDLNNK